MSAQPQLQADVAFHLTGTRSGEELAALEGLGLRPALLAAYRDLGRLRYDYPLILHAEGSGGVFEPLSALIDRELEGASKAAQDADRLRSLALRLERELRVMAAAGTGAPLAAMARDAERRVSLAAGAGAAADLARLRGALEKAGGELADCNAALPARLLGHAWRALRQEKAVAFRKRAERLVHGLREILRADAAGSAQGRSASSLKASVGSTHGAAFDFDALARVLATAPAGNRLSDKRRARIEATLATLRSQRFYPAPGAEALAFQFDSCVSALRAFRERQQELVRLAQAITVAELEIDGEFSALRHDALFERLATAGLELRDLALFPDYLVCVRAERVRAQEQDALIEILAGGLPVKVLLQSDDLLEDPLRGAGHAGVGARARSLASMALGLNEVYVLQAASSHLAEVRAELLGALRYAGPALINVFSGANAHAADLPPYLVAAAAMESRAFPAFRHDPAAGADWASRFALLGNPQQERDWPVHRFDYEGSDHQCVTEALAFTVLDFFACDARYAEHFATLPRGSWSAAQVPAAECIGRQTKGVPDRLPSLLMVDGGDFLHRVIVDERLLREAHRCREHWRSLQELGGVHNSHAERLLAREKQRWNDARQAEDGSGAPAAPATAPAALAEPEPATAPAPQEAPATDEPYVETPRCSSCDECIQINSKMFAYDANKQARIVDPAAGTYRQLVEAAESCQVAIIHPGKPKNLAEPGLEELLQRAQAFA
jgi:hypothetical protein